MYGVVRVVYYSVLANTISGQRYPTVSGIFTVRSTMYLHPFRVKITNMHRRVERLRPRSGGTTEDALIPLTVNSLGRLMDHIACVMARV